MSYAERLSSLNDATASTAEHIKSIKDNLTNKSFEDNPVQAGLETAGSVLGTAEGVARISREVGEGGKTRAFARAIYNKMGSPETLRQGFGDSLRSALKDHATALGQSRASSVADGQSRPAVRSRGTQVRQRRPRTTDGGTQVGERDLAPTFDELPSHQELGVPSEPTGVATGASQADAGRATASTGSNATKSTAKARAPTDDNPYSFSNFTSAEADRVASRPVEGVAGDVGDAGRAGTATVDDGANIVSRGRALNLARGAVPSRAGGGSVPGLRTQATSQLDTPSASASRVSQVASINSDAHATAQAPGSQVAPLGEGDLARNAQASGAYRSAGQRAQTADGGRATDASSGAIEADDMGTGARTATSGTSRALAGEESLDALAPETGPLAPILEVGSLLATAVTGIASLFEPQKKEVDKPKPPPPQGFSVGANLQANKQTSAPAF